MKTIPQNYDWPNKPSFDAEGLARPVGRFERTLPPAREAEDGQVHEIAADAPRTVIREYGGKVQIQKTINLRQL